MPQKPLFSKAKKSQAKILAANRHGKIIKTRKGKLVQPPKKDAVKEAFTEAQELTKAINRKNESAAAGKAEQTGGGKLAVVKAPPVAAKEEGKTARAKAK